MRKTTLIMLAWNGWPLTKRSLDSLRETDLADAEVIVVDNGSSDGTQAGLAGYASWVRVLRLPENIGFVRGNNAGIAAADPDSDIVLLNNDLVFTQRDWLRRLRCTAHASPDYGVVGCRLVLEDGRLVHTGTVILPDTCWGQQIESGQAEKDVGQYTRDRIVQGIVFAVAYLKRETITAIGGLSEDFVTYFEDTDYCLRARAAGFHTVLAGGVTLVHAEHGSSADADGFRERLFKAGQQIFVRKWKAQLEADYTRDLLWQSIMNFPTGYAMSARGLMRALDRAGTRVAYEYVYGPGSPFPLAEPDESDDYRMNVIRARRLRGKPEVAVVYGQGDVFARNRGRRRIGFTMLEVDGFPAEWVRQANQMDEVWVPSAFNRDGMLACGVRRPVEVIPLGIDPDYFHPGIVGHPNPTGEYVFLANFEWGERKEPWLLLKTFNRVFSADDPVRLIAKINNRDPSVDVAAAIEGLDLDARGGRISYLYNCEFPYYQLGSLYRSVDCYVSAGRGEGWDMPLMEAMACGLPSIATDWGAHREFVHADVAYPLAVRGTVPAEAKCPYYEGFRWADPDPEHLAHLLRHVYEHREEAAARGVNAAAEVAARWTWDHAARRMQARIAAVGGA